MPRPRPPEDLPAITVPTGGAEPVISSPPVVPIVDGAVRIERGPVAPSSRAARILAGLALVAALKFSRGILIPFVWAGFLSFVLTPMCRRLERLRLGRGIAAVVSVLTLTVAVGAVVWMSMAQAVDLVRRLPDYHRTIDAKLATLRAGGFALPLMEAGKQLKELTGPIAVGAPGGTNAPVPVAPVSVQVVEAPTSPLEAVGDVIGSVSGPLGDIAVILLLSIFFTAYHADIRERIIRMGTRARIAITAQALEDAATRVTRYLVSNLAVNLLYGFAVGVGLYFIGLPNAALWGVLCALLRFIPYLGTWVGALLPLAVSFAVFPGWSGTIWVFGTILAVDIVVGNVVEPLVYGHRTGLSPLIVILATVFWTWMWGITGIVLAVPLTLCLAVAGRYVPGLGMLHVLLGGDPVLDPSERAYDRLNAFDAEGAGRIAAAEEVRLGAVAAQDQVLVAALRRAERERREGSLDAERFRSICDGVRESLDDLVPTVATVAMSGRALCVPIVGEADRVACEIFVRLLEGRGVRAEVGPNGVDSAADVDAAATGGATVVCFVSLPPFAPARVRYFIQRARARHPKSSFVGVVLDPSGERPLVARSSARAASDPIAFGLADALDVVAGLVAATESDVAAGRNATVSPILAMSGSVS